MLKGWFGKSGQPSNSSHMWFEPNPEAEFYHVRRKRGQLVRSRYGPYAPVVFCQASASFELLHDDHGLYQIVGYRLNGERFEMRKLDIRTVEKILFRRVNVGKAVKVSPLAETESGEIEPGWYVIAMDEALRKARKRSIWLEKMD